MSWGWYAATLVFAVVDWLAVRLGKASWRKITKPAVLLVLIAGFSLSGGWRGFGSWFGLGLIFSLVGDVFLTLPPSYFMAGLGAFLVAHLAYIIGFNQSLVIPGWEFIIPMLALVVIDTLSFRKVRYSLIKRSKGRWIQYPLFVYMIVISLMLASSFLCWFRPDWPRLATVLVSLGALLFYGSDTALALNRFCNPSRGGQIFVIVTYHLAQLAITAGVLFRMAQT